MSSSTHVGTVEIVVAPRDSPPFAIDAIVEEEDTYLALSTEVELGQPGEHPARVMTQAHEAQALSPGAVVVRAGQPLRLLAVVHKLDETPSWREEWVARALDAVFREAGRRGLGALALPVLGGVHGKLDAARFWTLLKASIEATTSRPARIWLIR